MMAYQVTEDLGPWYQLQQQQAFLKQRSIYWPALKIVMNMVT